jgi:glycosyltransferase involved in cell wall biosynthesis
MNEKKRILFVNEASPLNTGFSVIGQEILTRLNRTNKYELAELGCYIQPNDPRVGEIPWKFYPVMPNQEDQNGNREYNSSVFAQFGEIALEKVCLDFQPDIVVDVRDHWMCEFQLRNTFRKNYKVLWMPTIDGLPQKVEWLQDYKNADMILTYSKFGRNLLAKEAPDINVFDVVAPGVNHDIYKPMDKNKIRSIFGIPKDANIIMTVMRNQKRKLYPDLIEMFKDYLKHCNYNNNPKLAKNTYLYLHTSYPDVGYDIARHIMQNGVGHRVLVSYKCHQCKKFYPDFFQTELTTCKYCGSLSGYMPNTSNGLTREELAVIYNLADLYVQYSICEGYGMPIAEAKACCIPAFAVDYSAMSEQVEVEGCQKIRVERFFHESIQETEQIRALPDNNDCIKKIYKFFQKPESERLRYGVLARKDIIDNCSFDRAAKVFESAIDSLEINDRNKTWLSQSDNTIVPNTDIPKNIRNSSEFIDWCIDNILCDPKLKFSFWRDELIKGLNVGYMLGRSGKEPCNAKIIVENMLRKVENNNKWEAIRASLVIKKVDDGAKKEIFWELI